MNLFLHYGDLCDATNLISIINRVQPDEIHNLGAMTRMALAFSGCSMLLLRAAGLEKKGHFYQSSTSELYGKVREVPQSETTEFNPGSP